MFKIPPQFSLIFLTALAPAIWGSTYIVTTEFLPDGIPLLASTLRALPAGILLILFCRQFPQGSWWLKLCLLGMLNIGIFFVCLFIAAYYLPGGIAAFVLSCQPILVILLSTLFLKEQFTSQYILTISLGITGIGLLVLNTDSEMNWQGIISGIFGAISMSLGIVFSKYWGRPQTMSLISVTGWQLFFGGLFLLPIAIWYEGFPESFSPQNLLGFGYLSIFGAILSYFIWFYAIEKLSVVSMSFLGALSPLTASLLGYLILEQSFHTSQVLGAIAILLSVYFSIPKSALGVTTHEKQNNMGSID
ncbi:EamA family transporter [Algicola sagamiensis]|uniref:EamA family transporter n=1 Tax=Algicola sagamiensis TaxID=163869 RepID=UPI0003A24158|nr:EamA family transporter [Algicola sagamiensis]